MGWHSLLISSIEIEVSQLNPLYSKGFFFNQKFKIMINQDLLEALFDKSDLELALYQINQLDSEKIVFSTSFGIEDQVVSHAIFSQNLTNIETFTLDTGRLYPETYSVWDKTLLQYGVKIKSFSPDTLDIENFVEEKGINAFYESIELRKECCYLRKVAPLKRALAGAKIWITGLRAEQSQNRNDLKIVEWDAQFQLYKFNPLLHWTYEEVKAYALKNGVPYNPLHDQGFVSIGCAPCTRAIKEGEDFRAGRWWWEDNSKKECGLHQK